jgi:beta-glucuronidase
MKKQFFNLTLFFLTVLYSGQVLYGQAKEIQLLQNIEAREKLTLDGTWKIIVDPLENGYYNHRYLPHEEGYFKNKKMESPSDLIEYDFDTDMELTVPGDWNTQMEKLYYYEGTVWYKKSFDFDIREEQRLFVYFEAVNYEAKVYLNGEFLGAHEGGFTPFQFEVSGKLREKDNFLIVKVDNKRQKDGIPTLNSDWWNYGGITRSVHVITIPDLHVSDYTIALSKDAKNIEGQVVIDGNLTENSVFLSIPELNKKIELEPESNGIARFSFKAKPDLWSPENPKLYKVEIQLGTEKITDLIGFRTIETKGYDILLNGKSVFLKGICIHEEAPYKTGRVTSEEEILTLLGWAKDLGCNYIRLAHYPHSEKMVKEAERLGLMIWSEIPVYWTVSFGNELTYALAEQQLGEMIMRDKNRAAVVLWGIANETPLSEERFIFLKKLAEKARSLDSSRLITAALDTQSEKNGAKLIDDPLGDVVDVIGINNYCGWYYGEPSGCSDVKWESLYEKPMIMSEVGGGALAGLHGETNERWTEEYMDQVYKYNLEMIDNISFLRGMTPWILMDFRSARRHLKNIQKDFNRKGLISEQGEKKKAYYRLQEYYRGKN